MLLRLQWSSCRDRDRRIVAVYKMTPGIARLDVDSVRMICSGQVIVDLAAATKELVENALDAGATSIDVRLVEYGTSAIECSDNGCGIPPSDFEIMAQRYSTSKLRDFETLRNVDSLGFRGEALASLCELASSLAVVTRCEAEKVGTRLVFNRNGALTARIPTARKVGTTVTVKELFAALPVRRADLQRNLKRQYTKTLRLLHGYALIATHCRLRVMLQAGSKRSSAITVQSGRSIKEGLSSLFGTNFPQTLEPISVSLNELDILNEKDEHSSPHAAIRRVAVGLVSRVGEGIGRSESDRQFIFINRRPINAHKIIRAINDVWRTFEKKQKPAFVLNLQLPRAEVDVNIQPDKREAVFACEASVICCLKTALLNFWEQTQGHVGIKHSLILPYRPRYSHSIAPSKTCNVSRMNSQGSEANNAEASQKYHMAIGEKHLLPTSRAAKEDIEMQLDDGLVSKTKTPKVRRPLSKAISTTADPRGDNNGIKSSLQVPLSAKSADSQSESNPLSSHSQRDRRTHRCFRFAPGLSQFVQSVQLLRRSARIVVQMDVGASKYSSGAEENEGTVEEKLGAVMSKSDFTQMEVLGQFNLGFLICKFARHLFIVDQHAADEKFRYEHNWRSTKIRTQPLLAPLILNLSAADELFLIEKREVFERNAFVLTVDENAQAGGRVKVSGVPSAKGITFGTKDIREFISLLAELKDVARDEDLPRFPKLHSLFASKACRSAVMIGTALALPGMKKLLDQLATLDGPWSCPHGRPTIRHLSLIHSLSYDS